MDVYSFLSDEDLISLFVGRYGIQAPLIPRPFMIDILYRFPKERWQDVTPYVNQIIIANLVNQNNQNQNVQRSDYRSPPRKSRPVPSPSAQFAPIPSLTPIPIPTSTPIIPPLPIRTTSPPLSSSSSTTPPTTPRSTSPPLSPRSLLKNKNSPRCQSPPKRVQFHAMKTIHPIPLLVNKK